ncbi:uncharacterized protein I206_104233 [Kwoniella pini CBS 10737]|uniref:Uncharacterized protein n=1 Tax=Kwoniella pini CBS 10737 TaxID=1296096 RepID=A0A1B9I2B5_9TREE|nr:uncharacterized protein I206_04189 [Kwoniella pini CBS 10737]OCF49667.1 hypothetical protein I206_04189 [Kwoniella pini CBS 10737]
MSLSNKVIPSEKDLAMKIENYQKLHSSNTYQFKARTIKNQIIIQIRHLNDNDQNDLEKEDEIGIQGYFTETKELIEEIENLQIQIYNQTLKNGFQNFPGVKSLEEMKSFRFDENNFPKKTLPPWGNKPPWEIEQDEEVKEDKEKKEEIEKDDKSKDDDKVA